MVQFISQYSSYTHNSRFQVKFSGNLKASGNCRKPGIVFVNLLMTLPSRPAPTEKSPPSLRCHSSASSLSSLLCFFVLREPPDTIFAPFSPSAAYTMSTLISASASIPPTRRLLPIKHDLTTPPYTRTRGASTRERSCRAP